MEINQTPGARQTSVIQLPSAPAVRGTQQLSGSATGLVDQSGGTPKISPEPKAADVQNAVDAINGHLQSLTGTIQFSLDPDTGNALIKIVDKHTNTVLLQIPSKQALAIAKELGKHQGLLIKETA